MVGLGLVFKSIVQSSHMSFSTWGSAGGFLEEALQQQQAHHLSWVA